jgi:hypothetical protein
MAEACYTGNGFETDDERAKLASLCVLEKRGGMRKRIGFYGGPALALTLLILAGLTFGTTVAGISLVTAFLALGGGMAYGIAGLRDQINATAERLPILAELVARKEASISYVQPPRETPLSRKRAGR